MAHDLAGLHSACIHCGLCLDACPTYRISGDEADSPRGRLLMMGSILDVQEGAFERESIDRCLGCRACERACPSGVQYGELLERSREELGPPKGFRSRFVAFLVDHIFPSPRALTVALRSGRIARALLPAGLQGSLLSNMPDRKIRAWVPPPRADGEGEAVALLSGCVQSLLDADTLDAATVLIEAAGGRLLQPPGGALCCGALSAHQGSLDRARSLGRELIDRYENCPHLVVPAAGCSAHLANLEALFAGDAEWGPRARRLSARSVDLVGWLASRAERLEFEADSEPAAWHPPCHQLAQGLGPAAARLLDRVPGLVWTPLSEGCCGSAGSYSIRQPQLAGQLREQRLKEFRETGANRLLSANPGCLWYLEAGLEGSRESTQVESLPVYLASRLLREGKRAGN